MILYSKKNNSKIMLINTLCLKFSIIKFTMITCGKFIPINGYQNYASNEITTEAIKNKFINHYNLKMLANNNDKLLDFYATLNTYKNGQNITPEVKEKLIQIGYTKENIAQYINLNYLSKMTENTSNFFLRRSLSLTHTSNSEKFNKLVKDFNGVEIFEYRINKGLEFYNKCIKYTSNKKNCMQEILSSTEFNDVSDVMFQLIFFKKII